MSSTSGNIIDFSSQWDRLWADLSPELKGGLELAALIGMLLVVMSLAGYLWQRSRGQNAQLKTVLWMMLFGAVLCAPGIIIPLLLRIVDMVANLVAGVGTSTLGG